MKWCVGNPITVAFHLSGSDKQTIPHNPYASESFLINCEDTDEFSLTNQKTHLHFGLNHTAAQASTVQINMNMEPLYFVKAYPYSYILFANASLYIIFDNINLTVSYWHF